MRSKVCVLIPSYNEARAIGAIVNALREKKMVVYVVDDGSSDDTAAIARAAGAVVVVHETNKGKGAALIEGFRHAVKKGFDAVLVMDGDGQHRVEDIDSFLKKNEEGVYDMIIGSRMHNTSSMPFVRLATNRFMSALLSRIAGQEIPDTQCGFKLMTRAVLENIRLESLHFDTESELIIKAARKGFRIGSVPIKTVYRNEVSRINPFVDTIRFFGLIIKLLLTK